MKQPTPETKQPEAIRRIAQSVSRLIMPDLSGLYALRLNELAYRQAERLRLEEEQEAIRERGFEAATRLSLSVSDAPSLSPPDYFRQITEKAITGETDHDRE